MSKRMEGKKRKILFTLILCSAALVLGIGGFIFFEKKKDILFYVDKEPIYREEAEFVLKKERLTVRNHIMAEYDLEPEEFSWEEEYGGKQGFVYLEEKIIEKCTQNKAIQIAAKELGIAADIDYPALVRMNQEDSGMRQERKKEGKAVYGNISYSAADYYDYVISNLEQQSYYYMVEEGMLEVTEEEINDICSEEAEEIAAAGLDEKETAETIGLQRKYAEYIRQRAENADIQKINKGGMRRLLEEAE